MPRSIVILIFLLLSIVSLAQNKTYVGVEASFAPDLCFSMIGNKIIHKSKSGITAGGNAGFIVGGNVRREFNHRLFAETGLLFTQYQGCYLFQEHNFAMQSALINNWIIPFRFGKKINLARNKLFLSPILGYSFCINPQHGSGIVTDFGTHQNRSGTYTISEVTHVNSVRNYGMLQSGLNLEFQMFKALMICASANYYRNFSKILKDDITYSFDNAAPQTVYGLSKARMVALGIGLKYAIHVRNINQ
jgi:hypothetical protein